MCICCLFTTQLSLVILGQISAARSESWYRKLEFCFTSFWFYYHRLWWSSWHAMLALFLLYVFLVCIFSWRDLFQVTGTDASWVIYIMCSQFITFEPVTLYSAYYAWFAALLASPYAVLLSTCPYLLLAQFDSSSLNQNSVWAALACAKLALRSVIMSFYRSLSLLLRLKVFASI